MDPPIEDLAKEWLRLDRDSETKSEIEQLLQTGNREELELRLRHRLVFGTAGLRGKMQAGYAFMNPLTVIQTTQGLAEYLLATGSDVKQRGVVLGRDARHNSEKYMRLVTAILVAKGIKVWCYGAPVHTPLVPFGVNFLNAAAGIMITASHNPAADNGYKVYWSNACQIIPPHDAGIAASIEKNLEPISYDEKAIETNFLVESELGQVRATYYKAVAFAATVHHQPDFKHSTVRFVYTPLHGVGLPYLEHVLAELGIPGMSVVTQQASPDPNFPTVKFPNPEEKGALDLAINTADAGGISLILANDPDADRLAVAEKANGKWIQYTGNQLGILLAAHVLETYPPDSPRDKLAMLATTVSSQMLSVLCREEGVHYVETLTGFKWLGNKAIDLTSQGYDVRFAFEEACGYMAPYVVHDKDGVAAAALFLTAVERWRCQGLTPWQKLQKLYERYGYFAEANTYLISPSPPVTRQAFAELRKSGELHTHPHHLGKRIIHRWRDLTEGHDSATHNHIPELPVDKSSEMITVELDGHVRCTVRASGTEPKIKIYIDSKAHSMEEAQKKADEVRKDVIELWFNPKKTGLIVRS